MRYLPLSDADRSAMLEKVGAASVDDLFRDVPEGLLLKGPIEGLPDRDSAPAERFRLPDGTTFGIIASTTEPFCATCDRSRLTADGLWLLCLYARGGLDLRHPLREGATGEELAHLISTVWSMRADRGAEERLGMDRQTTLVPLRALKKDAHLEMHTRGG